MTAMGIMIVVTVKEPEKLRLIRGGKNPDTKKAPSPRDDGKG